MGSSTSDARLSTSAVGADADSSSRSGVALEVEDLWVSYGKVQAVRGISFTANKGEFLTLLGPSGCGKTTTLRCIAGFEAPASGSVRMDGVEVATSEFSLPPERRNVNMVFQSYAIWPHMTVIKNVSYGLRRTGLKRDAIRKRAMEGLALVGLADYSGRYGTELSGGQQQRVAVARAIVTNPGIVLFDEPLSNLDAGLRERMRDELLGIQERVGCTAIYVTHDQAEAMAMSDRIVVMQDGVIDQSGPPRELYSNPGTMFTATFMGKSNILRGVTRRTSDGTFFVDDSEGLNLRLCPAADLQDGESCVVSFRPEDVLVGEVATISTENSLEGNVERILFLGNRCDVVVRVGDILIRVETSASFNGSIGNAVKISVPPHCLRVVIG